MWLCFSIWLTSKAGKAEAEAALQYRWIIHASAFVYELKCVRKWLYCACSCCVYGCASVCVALSVRASQAVSSTLTLRVEAYICTSHTHTHTDGIESTCFFYNLLDQATTLAPKIWPVWGVEGGLTLRMPQHRQVCVCVYVWHSRNFCSRSHCHTKVGGRHSAALS